MDKILSNSKRLSLVLLTGICLISAQFAQATTLLIQDRVVTGHITTDDGQDFPGVNILLKGTTVGTVSDANGKYSIRVALDESILVFSGIGYATVERTVGAQSVIDIAMTTELTTLAEVVVVGYGSVKKSDITGALVSVNEKTLRERPVQNVLQALQGKVSGMSVSSNIKPGETPSVQIRGQRSIQATNDPLYVVDGIPFSITI